MACNVAYSYLMAIPDEALRGGRLGADGYQEQVDDFEGQLREPLFVPVEEYERRQRLERETKRVALMQLFARAAATQAE